jgi:transcriptional regulator with XRE-family HTH domain
MTARGTPEEPIATRVRRRLRELRSERGMTLQAVADRANIDISTLSRLESGKRRLALDHIPALSTALGVSADELLGAASASDPRVRVEARRHDGMTVWPLTRLGPPNGPRAYKIAIAARRRRPPKELPSHEGLDWVYVLRGPLRLLLGSEEFVLEAGEAAEFSALTPHWLGAVDGPVELIMLVGTPGEAAHT